MVTKVFDQLLASLDIKYVSVIIVIANITCVDPTIFYDI